MGFEKSVDAQIAALAGPVQLVDIAETGHVGTGCQTRKQLRRAGEQAPVNVLEPLKKLRRRAIQCQLHDNRLAESRRSNLAFFESVDGGRLVPSFGNACIDTVRCKGRHHAAHIHIDNHAAQIEQHAFGQGGFAHVFASNAML